MAERRHGEVVHIKDVLGAQLQSLKASSSTEPEMKLLQQDDGYKVYDTGERVSCMDCGQQLPVTMTVYWLFDEERKRIERPTYCEECISKQAEREEKRRRMEQIRKLFDMSKLGPRFEQCKFENWKHRKELAVALKICKDYAASFREAKLTGQGLVLMGPRGTGKTHLAAAIAAELMQNLYSVIFQPVPVLLKRIQATYRKHAEEQEDKLLAALASCDLLILDDVGAEKWTEWVESTLFTIIDERYRHMLPLVITTNCSMEELEAQIGGRSFDRLVEVCRFVRMDAESYRVLKATGKL